jgi:hypothetical protein
MAKMVHIMGKLKFEVDTGITLWQAIKLRIAGKNYYRISNQIAKSIKEKLDKDYKEN